MSVSEKANGAAGGRFERFCQNVIDENFVVCTRIFFCVWISIIWACRAEQNKKIVREVPLACKLLSIILNLSTTITLSQSNCFLSLSYYLLNALKLSHWDSDNFDLIHNLLCRILVVNISIEIVMIQMKFIRM